eukprot:COSAG01_NODE_9362_length_2470_cov_1.374947_4_plen_124_part_00
MGLRRLRTAATRTLRLRLELGLFDGSANGPFSAWNSSNWVDTDAHRALARQSASESLILLRNEQELLPLDVSQLKHVAVIGPNANNTWALLSNSLTMVTGSRPENAVWPSRCAAKALPNSSPP